MAPPLLIAQKIFSLLQNNISQSDDLPPNQCTNCSAGSSAGHDEQVPSSSSPAPETAARLASAALRSLGSSKDTRSNSLVDLIFSSSAVREWLKIFVYGGTLEMLRRLVFYLYGRCHDSLFLTATFKEDDATYAWVCFWLSRQPAWRNARDLEVTTDAFGYEDGYLDIVFNGREVTFLPSSDTVYTMWYKGHWMRVSRFTKETSYGRYHCFLQLRILAHSHKILKSLISESKKAYQDAQQNLIRVYVSRDNSWRLLASRSKRSLRSIILDPGMKEMLIEDAKDFLSCKNWYAARGIPFRRGYLLYGAPGTGKTSIIHSLAGELALDVYIITLSKSGMDDTTLTELITNLPEKCIALMEDIDAAFSQTINRESNGSQNGANDNAKDKETDKETDKEKEKDREGSPTSSAEISSKITLSGLLNALDGVGAQEGRILFATTNKYHSLDPALCRPGRMDVHMEFKLASRHQARELFRRFYMSNSALEEEKNGFSSESDDDDDDDGIEPDTRTNGSDGISFREGHAGRHSMRNMSPAELDKLADEFADAIPVGELSMASLQGYLMKYKVAPETAVMEVGMWVLKEREESQRTGEGRKDEKPINNGVQPESQPGPEASET